MIEIEGAKQKIENYFALHREEMLKDIMAFIRIASVKGEPSPAAPFGEKNALMRAAAEERLKELGFLTKNYENYALTATYGSKTLGLDILGHLDVVPADPNGWTVTAPFEPLIKDGMIFGRGSADDKGPVVAAIYAIMAARDIGVPLTKGVRLILGFDEESGSADIEYFYQHESPACCTFTPDADFPVINAEKGGYWSAFEGCFDKEESPQLLSFHGGDIGNAIPSKASATISHVSMPKLLAAFEYVKKATGVSFQYSESGETVELLAFGETVHAATPDKGKNAVTALLEVLSYTILDTHNGSAALLALSKIFPATETTGQSAGIAMQDENGCSLTANLTILHYDGEHVNGRIDCRTPMCATHSNTVAILKQRFGAAGLALQSDDLCPAHSVPENSEFVQTLLRCYELYTGKQGKCLCSSGMTYAHHIPNAVAFGCVFNGRDNHMHGADEYAVIDELILSAKIFTQAIIELCS